MRKPVVFIDSGVGGLPYLEQTRHALPEEFYIYVADRAQFPYGTKSVAGIQAAVGSMMDAILRLYTPRFVVVACNTASVAALAWLRERYPFPFVGVVPAIKPAAALADNHRIGILATEHTIHDPYTDDLIAKFASDCSVSRCAGGDIVRFVEHDYFDAPYEVRAAIVRDAARQFTRDCVRSVVLGCTHFLYVEDELRAQLPPGTNIVDSREGVARQAVKISGSLPQETEPAPAGRLYVTGFGEPEKRYERFAERFNLVLGGAISVQDVLV